MLSTEQCEKARLSRDARFDGRFYTAVLTTGIFCRPICPARPPKAENVRYYEFAEQAINAGYRPCKRCFPELAPKQQLPAELKQAQTWLETGDYSISQIAAQLQLSERHFRRTFQHWLGLTPNDYRQNQRLLIATHLIRHTKLPMQAVAFAAGFNSIRRFNEAVTAGLGQAPSTIRKNNQAVSNQVVTLKLHYRPPLNWPTMLGFFRARAITSVEKIDQTSYMRSVQLGDAIGWFRVSDLAQQHALKLEVKLSDYRHLAVLIKRVRQMFDLDCDWQRLYQDLSDHPLLKQVMDRFPGVRLPGCWQPLEFSIRAILGQQISVKAATTLATRIAQKFGQPCATNPTDVKWLFPSQNQLVAADFSGLGITGKRQQTLQNWLHFCETNPDSLNHIDDLSAWVEQLCAVKGIGPWTAHYLAMRGLSYPDAFPASDLGLLKALNLSNNKADLTAMTTMAEHWRPWRSYATLFLWLRLSGEFQHD